jgi:epoxide hydrolase-like predicted phosphatase
MDKVKAVIFDWGGVLIDDPAPGLISYCSSKLGISPERFIVVCGSYLPEFQKGLISEAELWQRVCKDLKIPTPSGNSLWGEAFRHAYSPKQEMFDLAASLKRIGYKTAFLSNTEVPAMEYFYELDYQMFDSLTFSCAVKTRKPETKIYELTLGNLNVKPGEAIFIDDRIDYIEGAKKVGINTVLFESPSETKKKLESYSVLINPN